MHRALLLLVLPAAFALVGPVTATAADYVPGEVIVKYKDGTSSTTARNLRSQAGTRWSEPVPGGAEAQVVASGGSVAATVRKLNDDPNIDYAVPNYIARASAPAARASSFVPNDPGFQLQWNLAGPTGIRMPEAWSLAVSRGAPGGRGVVVAVLDTGVAYQRFRRYRRVPDLTRFVRGHDFVDRDSHPNDQNGHGTHVAGTIAQSTDNGIGTAGIAYEARIMPVRVLDRQGQGDTVAIARGIRYAVRRGADVINLSLEFDAKVRAAQIPNIVAALDFARERGVLVVAAAGNEGAPQVAYPARVHDVLAVAATTAHGCQAEYSNSGFDVDIAAPGGGKDAINTDTPYDASVCRPTEQGQFIYQQTFNGSIAAFGLPAGYEGTSMAAPHVTGVAALVIASRRLGRDPSPAAIKRHLQNTARDLGAPGSDPRYGAGLLDAAAALR